MAFARNVTAGALVLAIGAFSYSAFAHTGATIPMPRFANLLSGSAASLVNAAATAAPVAAPEILTDEAFEAHANEIPRAAGVKAARAETDNYVVELRALPQYAAGREATFEVVVESKGAYHINPQFPLRFKANEAPKGITYSKPVLNRDDGSFTEKSGGFKVPFVAAQGGGYNLGGTISLSFCSEKNCLMEKVALDVDVTVK